MRFSLDYVFMVGLKAKKGDTSENVTRLAFCASLFHLFLSRRSLSSAE
jgi:hypothetical protein